MNINHFDHYIGYISADLVQNSACLRRLECPLDALEVQQDSLCVGVGLPAAGRAPAEGPRVVVRLLLSGGGLRCLVSLQVAWRDR